VQSKLLREFSRGRHKHSTCISEALQAAEENCRQRGIRFTAIRRRVLELVWAGHEPVKAYDLLDILRSERSSAAPPTIYRALEFLLEEGLVHKIESLNAYVGCGKPGHSDSGQFLICSTCGEVAELDDSELVKLISKKARQIGFSIKSQVVEIMGCCAQCSASGR
jgi:Fur family transcriptional regulator, zinc uptake regulator